MKTLLALFFLAGSQFVAVHCQAIDAYEARHFVQTQNGKGAFFYCGDSKRPYCFCTLTETEITGLYISNGTKMIIYDERRLLCRIVTFSMTISTNEGSKQPMAAKLLKAVQNNSNSNLITEALTTNQLIAVTAIINYRRWFGTYVNLISAGAPDVTGEPIPGARCVMPEPENFFTRYEF